MFWAVRQLSVPLNYLRIRHGHDLLHSKVVYDFVLPVIMTLFTYGSFFVLGARISIFSNAEIVKRILDLLALLIAFYMAALAAVSTFERQGIDDPLPDQDAILKRKQADGSYKDKPLSYRQFISYCFGYLSFLSLAIYMFLTVTSLAWDGIENRIKSAYIGKVSVQPIVEGFIFLTTFFLIWQLMITSMLGIYFLTERMQTLSRKS